MHYQDVNLHNLASKSAPVKGNVTNTKGEIAPHPTEVEKDPTPVRDGTPHDACPATARDDRDPRLVGELDEARNLFHRLRDRDEVRDHLPLKEGDLREGGEVMAVHQPFHRVPGDPLRTEDVDEASKTIIKARQGPVSPGPRAEREGLS